VEMMQLAILSDRKIKQADRPPMLQAEDWDTLKVYKDFLEPYRDAILETEGYEDGLNLVLQAMDELLEKLEQGKIDHAADAQFSASIETSWNVMEKYYKLTDESPAYSAAVVMDPRWKWAYFETYWATDFLKPYVRKAKTSVSLHSIKTLESMAKIDRHAIFGPNSINTTSFLQCRPKIRPQYR
jgi:soluble cytochrome b562